MTAGLLLDVFLVRTLLVPALIVLFGARDDRHAPSVVSPAT